MENESFSVDAVIIYAQKVTGFGAVFSITFAIFNDEKETEELVPFAKAYSGLSNSDKVIDRKIKKITEESYGPVKVRPEIIVECFLALYQNQ